MILPGTQRRVQLGEPSPEGGVLADTTPPPARPAVVDEGVEFEPVWFPHRNAASLLGDEAARPSTLVAYLEVEERPWE